MSDRIELTVEEVTAKLAKTKGNVSHAARQLRVSRAWLNQFISDREEVKAALVDIRDAGLDEAETMLQNRMRHSDTLLIFFLKTQGKKRGYVEKVEHGGSIDLTVKGYITVTPDDWDETEG